MMAGMGVQLEGGLANPLTLNNWLKANNGFFDGDRFNLPAPGGLGFPYQGSTENMAYAIAAVYAGEFVILNVHEGTHWVLALSTNGVGFNVYDPYYPTSYYAATDCQAAIAYKYA